jgi:hypothetical protein
LKDVCDALRNAMVTFPENRVKCGAAGGVEALVKIVKAYHSLPSTVIESACAALWNVLHSMPEHQRTCGEDGGVEALVSVIRHYVAVDGPVPLLVSACWMACGALRHAILTIDANKAKCIQAGALATIGALIKHCMAPAHKATRSQKASLFTEACAVLEDISVFSSKQGASLGNASEMEVLVGLVNEWHRDAPEIVMQRVCATISTLVASNCNDDQNKFVVCGGADAFVNLAKRCSLVTMADVAKLHDVCKVLTVVATNNADSKTKICAVSGFMDTIDKCSKVPSLKHAFDKLSLLVVMSDQPNEHKDSEAPNNQLNDSTDNSAGKSTPNNQLNDSTDNSTDKSAGNRTKNNADNGTNNNVGNSVNDSVDRSADNSINKATISLVSNADQHEAQHTDCSSADCSALLQRMEQAAAANHELLDSLHSALRGALSKQTESTVANQQLQHALQAQVEQLKAQVASQSAVIERMESTIANQAIKLYDAQYAHAVAVEQKQVAEAKLAENLKALQSILLNADEVN